MRIAPTAEYAWMALLPPAHRPVATVPAIDPVAPYNGTRRDPPPAEHRTVEDSREGEWIRGPRRVAFEALRANTVYDADARPIDPERVAPAAVEPPRLPGPIASYLVHRDTSDRPLNSPGRFIDDYV